MQRLLLPLVITMLWTGPGHARSFQLHVYETKILSKLEKILRPLRLGSRSHPFAPNKATEPPKKAQPDTAKDSTKTFEVSGRADLFTKSLNDQRKLDAIIDGVHLRTDVQNEVSDQVKKQYGLSENSQLPLTPITIDKLELATNKTGIFARGHRVEIDEEHKKAHSVPFTWLFPIMALNYTGDLAKPQIERVILGNPTQTNVFSVWGQRSGFAIYPTEREKLDAMTSTLHLRTDVRRRVVATTKSQYTIADDNRTSRAVVDQIIMSPTNTAVSVNGHTHLVDEKKRVVLDHTFYGLLPIETIEYLGEIKKPDIKSVTFGEEMFAKTVNDPLYQGSPRSIAPANDMPSQSSN